MQPNVTSLVLTLIGKDQRGIVEQLARIVADHDGNWEESQMARLAGRFAGVLRVSVPSARADALAARLRSLADQGLAVVVELDASAAHYPAPRVLHIEVVGNDHPGIVRDLTSALTKLGVNIEALESACIDAPHSGDRLFHASLDLSGPDHVTNTRLRESLEGVAAELMVDLSLDD